MLDINFIRNNPDVVKQAVKNKLFEVDIDRLLLLDKQYRAILTKIECLRRERNELSHMGKSGRVDEVKERAQELKTELAKKEKKFAKIKEELDKMMLLVPSIPAPEVPIGKDENDNIEIRKWGKLPNFDFQHKDHVEICERLNIVDFSRASKFAGSRAYFLKNEGMLLEMAICRYVIDFLVSKGFTAMSIPVMVKYSAMQGTGYFPIGYDQAYKITEDDLFLVGTSEVSLISYYQNETINEADFPIKLAGYSTCFRREAGSAGKDTRGLYRVHQFQKVEQVIICKNNNDEAEKLHLEILSNVETIMQNLKLPYRVCLACTGEIGIGQVKKHEVEAWMPSRNAYCETHSCSTMGDFQARRSNIKFRNSEGNLQFAYTLNNTAIASPRILIPILENYQQKDGSVLIPDVLQPYMLGQRYIFPKQ